MLETPSLRAEPITEVMSSMDAYMYRSFFQPIPSTPWFDTGCSYDIHDKEVAHKMYLILQSPESYTLYISANNHAKFAL